MVAIVLYLAVQPPYGTSDQMPSLHDVLVPGFVFVIAIGLIVRDICFRRSRRRAPTVEGRANLQAKVPGRAPVLLWNLKL